MTTGPAEGSVVSSFMDNGPTDDPGSSSTEEPGGEADQTMRSQDDAMKPPKPELIVENIPAELKQRRRWIGWRYDYRDEKWDKRPVACGTGKVEAVSKAGSRKTFDEALRAVDRHTLDGVGFVFQGDDGITGIDLDNCRDPETGCLTGWAEHIVRSLNSYTEVSPSGSGLHVFVKGRLPTGGRNRRGNIEFYDRGRYFTVTGRRLEGTPSHIVDRQAELMTLHGLVFETDSTALVERAGQGAGGEKFHRLWAGDDSGYDSPSEADQALCGILAYWTFADPKRMEKLFNESGLGKRQKWTRREDYRKQTIEKAVAGQLAKVFTRGNRSSQEKTEKTRNKHIAVPAEDRQGKGIQMAVELATTEGMASEWVASFKLARRLRTLAVDNPEQFESAVEAFCQKAGRDFEPLWYAFLDCWDSVRHAEGDGQMKWAAERAEEHPYPLSYYPGRKCDQYKKLASLAYHLSRLTAPDPFWLTRDLVAPILGCKYPNEVTRLIRLLEKHGVIKCVDSSYRFAGQNPKAKEYKFIGGPHNV